MRKLVLAVCALAALVAVPDIAAAQSSTTLGVGTGAVAGAIVGGPIGAVVGGVAGGFIGANNEPRRYRAARSPRYGHYSGRRSHARHQARRPRHRVIYSTH